MISITKDRTIRRKRRVSLNMFGKTDRPRVHIHRTNKYIYAQAINDETRQTVAAFSSLQLKRGSKEKLSKTAVAKNVGLELGRLLKEKKVNTCIFDRSKFLYHGRVQAVADGLREAGIQV